MAEAVNLEARITLMDRFSNRLKAAGRGVKSFGGSVKELGERFKESDTAMNVFHAGILRFGGTVGRVGLMVWKTGSLIKRTVFNVVKRAMDALKMWLKRLWLMAKIVLPIMGSMFIHMSKQFEVALRNVTSLMAGAGVPEVKIEKQFKTWKRQLQNMSIQYGIDDAKLADGLYQVVSATFEEADAMKVLDVATKGASATLTDIDQMTALLTKTLHSFRKETETLSQTADKAGMIMDSFFMTLARGMFTMDEFVPSFQA
ncbi:MAG: hypothetical protein OXI24_09790, partial [Candidatus Poribacteria bacterium]|nr:hypothetical protein [Candidatus Poribacteria bacterium]